MNDSQRLVDVNHLGRDRVIGCWQVGELLIDPGPESSIETLLEALGSEQPRALLLTHIHLDHAGGTGALVRRWPELEVYVHEIGAPHLADPSKLLRSAAKLYGDEMDRLWGEVVPVPEQNLRPLSGGERIDGFEVAYTPGHASHHVSYLHRDSGQAFVGDIAGVRIPPAELIQPPTPPPDIDLELWRDSLLRVADWEPASLGITHFGTIEDPLPHLERVGERLTDWAEIARRSDRYSFEQHVRDEAANATDAETAATYAHALPPEQQWLGLNRYWETREP
jgi:glyoxylase-like metal-dependent hydrolase (beta-lactamase superfamily II)